MKTQIRFSVRKKKKICWMGMTGNTDLLFISFSPRPCFFGDDDTGLCLSAWSVKSSVACFFLRGRGRNVCLSWAKFGLPQVVAGGAAVAIRGVP